MAKISSVRAFNLTVLGLMVLGVGYYFYDQIREQTHVAVATAILIAGGLAALFGVVGLFGIDQPYWIAGMIASLPLGR